MSTCTVVERGAQQVVSIRRETTAVAIRGVIGEVFEAIDQYLAAAGVEGDHRSHGFSAYHDLSLTQPDMDHLHAEVGFLAAPPTPLEPRGEIQSREIPAGRYAQVEHAGPLSRIGEAYALLTQWLTDNRYSTSGTIYEIYMHDTFKDPVEDEAFRATILFALSEV
jgi:effector-binding domain-containing protein